MDLKISDVADLLNVPETTIKRWVSDGDIPNYQIDQLTLFSRTDIENWMISRKNESAQKVFPFTRQKEGGSKQFSLFRAIHKGEVLHRLKGNNKEEVIRATMRKVAKFLNVDADVMTDLLLDRERLMPTALGHGIAVPHTRDSLLSSHHDVVIPVFLDHPLEYGALDGRPVHTLFFLFACEDKRHLHLLAKIAHLSNQSEALNLFQLQPSKEELLSFIKNWESSVPKS